MTFSHLALYFQKLEETASRNTMTEILADFFRLTSSGEIGKICYLFQGRVAPLYEPIEFGIADKLMIRAIAKAFAVTADDVIKAFKKSGDLGIAVENISSFVKQENPRNMYRLTVTDVFQRLEELTKMSGEGSQEKKIDILSQLFCSIDALSARYLARIPLDKLRLGFSDMTILDALSWMLMGNKSLRGRLEDVYNIRPDIGLLAQQVKAHGIEGLSQVKAEVGAPILASLCQRLPTADEMIEKMVNVAVEPKWDGVRVQIHYSKTGRQQDSKTGSVKTFSRNLENTTAMFPELADIGKQIHATSVILDCEAVGVDPKTGKLIPFQETMTRKRKHEIGKAQANVPLQFYVFDILYKDGKELLTSPLSERRRILESTIKKGTMLLVSPQIVTDTASAIITYHHDQLKKGLEGVVVKKWESPYEPGRRGYSWVKFKEEEGKIGKLTDTIDAVVMGYTSGEGKRTAFGIGQVLLGVRDGEDFLTITKLGTGATEKELGILFATLNKLKSAKQPKEYKNVGKMYTPDVWVTPGLVLEIAGDDITISPAHGAGFAVRFPRLVKIRSDKSPGNTTTVSELRAMYHAQKNTKHRN